MGYRYGDIKRGALLKKALDGYTNYLQNNATDQSGIGTQGPRNLTKELYIQPYTAQVGTTEVLLSKCTPESFTTLNTYINTSTFASAEESLGANTLIQLPRFSASRIVFFENATRSVTVATSQVTTLKYLKYSGTRYSMPFGATADTDDEMEAFLDIKASILAGFSASAIAQVSLKREYVGVG